MNRLVIVAAGLLLVASFGAGLLYSGVIRLDDSPLSQIAKPNIGGPFQLTDQTGKPFSTEQLKGKPYLVFFGFTHCPDVCPTTLMEVTNHMADPAIKDSGLRALFVSVDPSRDTPELLKTYLSNFDPGIVGLTGTEEEIAEVAKKFRGTRLPLGPLRNWRRRDGEASSCAT
ncbi:MAG: SCO family protein, partial [Pseudomonadota bacterium]